MGKLERFRQSLAAELYKAAKMQVGRWLYGIQVPEVPWMTPGGLAVLKQHLSKSQIYLEYGSGGSTVMASSHVQHLYSVDSDVRFLRAVEKRVASSSARFYPLHVDIGLTRALGVPVVQKPTTARVAKWKRYPQQVWELLAANKHVPDLVLIDGRFRVACVLESFLQLPSDVECVFLLDDVVDGRDYSAFLDLAENVSLHDRLMSFRRRRRFDRSSCEERIHSYYSQWI